MEGWYRQNQVKIYDASKGQQTFTLTNAQTDSGNCIIIPNGQLADDLFSEYFILEYVTKDGNNSAVGTKTAPWVTAGEYVSIILMPRRNMAVTRFSAMEAEANLPTRIRADG